MCFLFIAETVTTTLKRIQRKLASNSPMTIENLKGQTLSGGKDRVLFLREVVRDWVTMQRSQLRKRNPGAVVPLVDMHTNTSTSTSTSTSTIMQARGCKLLSTWLVVVVVVVVACLDYLYLTEHYLD